MNFLPILVAIFDKHRIPLVLPKMIILYLFFKFLSEKQWQNLNQRGDIDIFRSTWMRRKTSDKILQKDWFMN